MDSFIEAFCTIKDNWITVHLFHSVPAQIKNSNLAVESETRISMFLTREYEALIQHTNG